MPIKELKKLFTYQAVQLRNRTLVTRLTYIPDFDASLPTSIYMSCWVADSYCTNHFTMIQGVDLASMARYPWSNERIRRERYWLHLTVCSDMKGVSSVLDKKEEF